MPPYSIPRRSAAKQEDQMPLNWRRGMFRMWLVLSAAWIMGWIIAFLVYGIQGGFRTSSDFLAIPILLFGPPVAAFIFGIAVGWAFRGFVVDEQGSGNQGPGIRDQRSGTGADT